MEVHQPSHTLWVYAFRNKSVLELSTPRLAGRGLCPMLIYGMTRVSKTLFIDLSTIQIGHGYCVAMTGIWTIALVGFLTRDECDLTRVYCCALYNEASTTLRTALRLHTQHRGLPDSNRPVYSWS